MGHRVDWRVAGLLVVLAVSLPRCTPTGGGGTREPPSLKKVSLYEALDRRHTTRRFIPDADLGREVLRDILWAAEGVNRGGRDDRFRTSPCSFQTRTVTLYVLSRDGVFVNDPITGTLTRISDRDLRDETSRLWRDKRSPYLVLLVGNKKTLRESALKAGWTLDDQTLVQVLWADAAVIAENIYLACAALDVGTGILAGLNEDAVRSSLGLEDTSVPIFAMTLGREARDPVE